MVADSCNQFDLIRQLDEIVIRSRVEGFALCGWFFLGGEYDNWHRLRQWIVTILSNKIEPIYTRHHQILQDYRGSHLIGDLDCIERIGAIMKVKLGLARQRASD